MPSEQVLSQRARELRGRGAAPHYGGAGDRGSAVQRGSRRCLIAVAVVLAVLGGTAAAQSGPPGSVLFNSQVNTAVPAGGMIGAQPAVDAFPQNAQSEPSVALDPATGALIAGGNDAIDEPLCSGAGTSSSPGSCAFAAGVGVSGMYRSSDSGMSWTQPSFIESPAGAGSCQGHTIHTLPGYCDQKLESFGDPALTVGPAMGNHGRFSWSSTTATLPSPTASRFRGSRPLRCWRCPARWTTVPTGRRRSWRAARRTPSTSTTRTGSRPTLIQAARSSATCMRAGPSSRVSLESPSRSSSRGRRTVAKRGAAPCP